MLIALLVFFCNLSVCLAQDGDYEKKGRLISKGSNTTPVGELKVTTYRLEVIKLTKPLDRKDSKPPLETAFRLVIMTDEPLPVGSYNIWIDDVEYQAHQVQPNAVAVIKYVRTLPNGVMLALSKWGEKDLTARSVLPETLNVPDAYTTSLQEIEENRPVIKLRRLTNSTTIEIRVKVPNVRCTIANNPLVIRIDSPAFSGIGLCDGDVFIHWLPVEKFAQLSDGAEILLAKGSGRELRHRRVVGRLDKSSLDR
jgi:hypothetical protein